MGCPSVNSNENFITIKKQTRKFRRTIRLSAPNRILSLTKLNNLLLPELKKCVKCGFTKRKLADTKLNGIATGIHIICDRCEDKKKKEYRQMLYLKRSIDQLNSATDSQELRQKKR